MSYVKAGLDLGGAVWLLGALLGALPAIGALLAVIWYCFQIWESTTFQKLWVRALRVGKPAPQGIAPPTGQAPPLQAPSPEAQETAKPA